MKNIHKILLYLFILILYCSESVCFKKRDEFDIISNFFNRGLMRGLEKHIENNKDVNECFRDIKIWARDFIAGKLWALKMIDSNGKIPSGLLMLNTHSFGQFDQCMSINHQNENEDIKGKYCLAKIPIQHFIPFYELQQMSQFRKKQIRPEGINSRFFDYDEYGRIVLDLGICIPNSCNNDEIRDMINEILEDKNVSTPLVTVPENLCTTQDSREFTPADWGAVAFFAFFGVLVVVSTIIDITARRRNKNSDSKCYILLTSFSVYTNTSNLMRNSRSPKNIRCLHGIRVLSLFWIILAHRFSYIFWFPFVNLTDFATFSTQPGGWMIMSAVYAVDTFFVLSGLLVSYIIFSQLNKNDCFNFPMMYLHRYLRLTPALAAAMFFQGTLFRYIGDGPLWNNNAEIDALPCRKYWWTTLLYVQNYVNPGELCVFQSWYLSCDMQFFILSPIVIYPLLKWKRVGVANLVFWILLAQIGTFVIAYENEWSAAALTLTGNENKGERFGLATHAKGTPWLLGFATGYVLHLCTKRRIKLNKIFVAFGWIVSFALMAAVVFGWKTFQDLDHEINHLEDTTFNAFNKTTWSVALVWIIIACTLGYGGPINWFLSWNIWEVLGKFSYSTYLVHMMMQYWQLSMMRQPEYLLDFYAVVSFFGDAVLSFFVGYLLMISFELPFAVLERIIFDKKKPKKIERNPDFEVKNIQEKDKEVENIEEKDIEVEDIEKKDIEVDNIEEKDVEAK